MTKLNKTIGLQFALILQGLSLRNLERDEEGQTLAEYAMILALIAIIVVVAVGVLGGTINGLFQQINSKI